jgi:p-aminobenzoyl-glutamate transporter AbgT
MVLLSSLIFPLVFSAVAKLTGEFTSLEEPTDDLDIVIVLVLLADGSGFAGSKMRVELKNLMQKLRLPIVNFIFWFSSTSKLLLAKSKKDVEFMIPTPQVPTDGAN